jgi:hypothetical protein
LAGVYDRFQNYGTRAGSGGRTWELVSDSLFGWLSPNIIFSCSYSLGIGKGDQVRKSTISQVDFFIRDDETAQRLARALNQLRKLCEAHPESDPFATH